MRRAWLYISAVPVGVIGGELGGFMLGGFYTIFLDNIFATLFGCYCTVKFADWFFKFSKIRDAIVVGITSSVLYFVGNSVLFFLHEGTVRIYSGVFCMLTGCLGIYIGCREVRSDINERQNKKGRNLL